MSEVKFSARAFCKMCLHAIKYPHCAINGVLLAKSSVGPNFKEIEFVDAVPLFHINLNLTPMAEIALMQIDEMASKLGLIIAGYYTANEHLKDNNNFDKVHHKIAEKIAQNCSSAFVVLINNTKLTTEVDATSLKVAQLIDGNFKRIDENLISLNPTNETCQALMVLMQQKAFNKLTDFDNHLDDIRLDWMNMEINENVKAYL